MTNASVITSHTGFDANLGEVDGHSFNRKCQWEGHLQTRKFLIQYMQEYVSIYIRCDQSFRCGKLLVKFSTVFARYPYTTMMTSSNGTFFRVTGPLWGECTGGFSSQSQLRWALMFSLSCAWTNGWANYQDAVDWRRYCTHYDVTVMTPFLFGEITIVLFL